MLFRSVAWLENHAPAESVLYHRALGWHYRFTFFDANRTGQNRYDLRWYPHAVYLADNAAKIPQQRRFLVLPDWMPVLHAERDFAARALELVERYRAGKFTVFEVIGPPQDPCNWCVCQGDALQKGLPSWLH